MFTLIMSDVIFKSHLTLLLCDSLGDVVKDTDLKTHHKGFISPDSLSQANCVHRYANLAQAYFLFNLL